MPDGVFPASKPAINGTTAAANGNGNSAATIPAPGKSHLYNPTPRIPYRPQPHHRRHRRSGRSVCCCCCFWTILIVLILALIVSVCGIALYMLYRPRSPEFSVPFLRIHRLNLTTAADSSSSHLSTLLNMTIFAKNPNSHISFLYDPFVLTALSDSNDVQLGNGSLPGFSLQKKNETTFRGVLISASNELDVESVTALRSDLKKKNGVGLMIQMDTQVKVMLGGLNAKKIGIRVKCDTIKGVVPKGKTPSVAVTTASKCKVDLRFKIWKWTL